MTEKLLEEKILNAASFEKCLLCRCFRETLETLNKQLKSSVDEEYLSLLNTVKRVKEKLLVPQYT